MISKQLLVFEEVYLDEALPKPQELIKGVDQVFLLKLGATMAAKAKGNYQNEIEEGIKTFFGPTNNDYVNSSFKNTITLKRAFFNEIVALQFMELVLKEDLPDEITISDQELERRLFKAFLVLNSAWAKKQEVGFKTTEDFKKLEDYHRVIFCSLYPDHDKSNYNLGNEWTVQIIKAHYFFNFLTSLPECQELLVDFYKYFGVSEWKEYIKKYLALVTELAVKKNHEKDVVCISELRQDYDQVISIVDKMAIPVEVELDEWDFLTLRSKPYFKLGKGEYLILFDLFTVDKIFKGLYFFLNELNKQLESNKCKSFRNLFTYEFSEQTLLYNALAPLYNNAIKFSGKDLALIDGSPDYYIRSGKSILLFESKNVLVRKDKKMSYDYNIYDEELYKKFYEEFDKKGKQSNKAILQLIENIKRVLHKKNEFDNTYRYKEVKIYPILITHDIQYDTPGLEKWLNDWFQEEVDEMRDSGFFVGRIQPLVIINIDTLLLYAYPLEHSIELHDAIDIYIKSQYKWLNQLKRKCKSIEEFKTRYLKGMDPFSKFLEKYLVKNRLQRHPALMDEIGIDLFNPKSANNN